MEIDEAPAAEEEPLTDDNDQAEITDPDDIDALLESMATDEAPAAEEKPLTDDDGQAEITDPDDIDALLASMATNEAPLAEEKLSTDDNVQERAFEEEVDKEKVEQAESENKAKIESLTEEYVAPLLAIDFSEILAKSTDIDLIETDASQEKVADDDFDIDLLLENIATEQNTTQDTEFDIGDDLAEGAFDEDTLAELLSDKPTEHVIELTPDFSEQNVLAELLNDNDESSDNSQVSEATEINDIQELDSLNFDELLANIEEESSVTNQSVDFNENLDVGDDVSLEDFDNLTSSPSLNDNKQTTENEQSFLSVDSLLLESEDEVSHNEPYDKTNIDVGLNEFPEFTDGVNQIDVDIDENGMEAKLDLAKVYIEIGDQDNAHAILQEVVKQGDTQQQVTAQELLDSL